MFGYVTANRDELNAEELIRYRGCYCGLCRTLAERYGQPRRTAISYDFAFLVLLLSSLYEPTESSGESRCTAHPAKPQLWWTDEFTGYAADMNVVLGYYNFLDDWKDEHSAAGYMGMSLLGASATKAQEGYPRQVEAIVAGLDAISAVEKDGSAGVDAGANLFGTMLGEVFAVREDRWASQLSAVGAGLGRFIYMMDAYVDVEGDMRKGRYNPLAKLYDTPGFEDYCADMLTMLIGECASEFEKLPLMQDIGILRNVLYSGVWMRYAVERTKRLRKGGSQQHDGKANA